MGQLARDLREGNASIVKATGRDGLQFPARPAQNQDFVDITSQIKGNKLNDYLLSFIQNADAEFTNSERDSVKLNQIRVLRADEGSNQIVVQMNYNLTLEGRSPAPVEHTISFSVQSDGTAWLEGKKPTSKNPALDQASTAKLKQLSQRR